MDGIVSAEFSRKEMRRSASSRGEKRGGEVRGRDGAAERRAGIVTQRVAKKKHKGA